MLGTFDDYAEMIIQFGYATMFVAAFPLAAIMSFVNNYIGTTITFTLHRSVSVSIQRNNIGNELTMYFVLCMHCIACCFVC